MVDLGKFLKEEYEEESERITIAIILPMNSLQWVADIQIFSVDFCKSKDLFVKFLLFLLENEDIPLFKQDTLLTMITEFDLYSISYNEQVRRLKMGLTSLLYDHSSD